MTGGERVDLLIVGAGPCGLAAAISAQRAGLRAVVFDAGCVVSTIAQYPTYATFFSTAEKLGIGGLPFVVAAEKPTRRDALAYYRAAVRHFGIDVRQYQPVEAIELIEPESRKAGNPEGPRGGAVLAEAPSDTDAVPRDAVLPDSRLSGFPGSRLPGLPARFAVRTRTPDGAERPVLAHAVLVATGFFGSPNYLGVPGEELPHVRHRYKEGHEAFLQDAVVIGGGNSAAEAALDLWRSGARVTLAHFGPTFDMRIKPWVLPDFTNRVAEGRIAAVWNSRVQEITPTDVVLRGTDGTLHGVTDEVRRLPAQHVYVMTGFAPNLELLRRVGVTIDAATGVPAHDAETLETDVPGVFIAGVVVAGYDANRVFIENGRHHGDKVVARLVGGPTPAAPQLSAEFDS